LSGAELALLILGALAYLAIGSFTCVVIDRLPIALDEPNDHGELWDSRPWSEVFGGRSRCSDCGTDIRPIDNIPVVSWLVLRGRCRACGSRIPAFHPLVELSLPLLFLGALWALGLNWTLLPALWLMPVGVAVAVIDLRTLIVPTRIVWPAFLVSVLLCVVAAGLEGEWGWLLSALVGMLALAGPLFLVWFAIPHGMGFGDVRLSTLLGFNVGFYAAGALWSAAFLAALTLGSAAVLGILMGVIALGARGRGAKVPFGPALVAASFLSIAFAEAILDTITN
jgi:leader peptidase (prepilin peptidase)/N-methyltransferase